MPISHRDLTGVPADPPLLPAGTPLVRVSGLDFRYPDGRQALMDVSFTVKAGERVALVGPNGAGKSTLLLHLNGILAADGRVQIAGLPVIAQNLPRIRALVGLVFDDPDDQLFSPTVYEDVAFGPLHMGYDEAEVRRRVKEALELVGMAGQEDRLSHHLSQGEKRRIAIATVLAMRPMLLVLDEPSASLDPRARRQLIELLRGLSVTMLCATHDLALVREVCPRTLVLNGGRMVADGPTEAIFADVEFLERYGLAE